MKMVGNGDYQRESQIAYADWDVDTLTISNEVIFANPLPGTTTWYPSWTAGERFIIYTQGNVMLAFDLDTRQTTRISANPIEYRYPNAIGVVK
jgi:hypothetical protein